MEHRTHTLTEYQTTTDVALSEMEADWLHRHVKSLDVRPAWGSPGKYDLTAGSHVGTVSLPHLTILIRPKVPAERVLFLISYALDPAHWQDQTSSLDEQSDLVEGMAAMFGIALRRALAQGILQGYRSKQEALSSVRGRIRFDEQLRRRFLTPIPLEVEYDDFTIDTELNRLLFSALRRLKRMPIRSTKVKLLMAAGHTAFADGVTAVEFTPNSIPELHWTRLNQHFKVAVELAVAILAGASIELEHGALRGSAFMIDMNLVFERFLRTALRDALSLSRFEWPERPKVEALDLDRRIAIQPDLTWLEDSTVVFVGDAKYKRVAAGGAPNADLYQLNAYATAFALPAGLLVYAEGQEPESVHVVRHTGTRLIIRTLDINGQPAEVLASVRQLATRIRDLRVRA